ncbi:MAG: hypothetical protein R2710_18250 [Acidimicrobiales bacterium]
MQRRLTGEPLAWICGSTPFCGLAITIRPGVYVPREHSEPLARRAAGLPPLRGIAVEICTGSGAIAAAIAAERLDVRVVATDLDPVAVACASDNGVDALQGDLFTPLPDALRGTVDVVVGVVPYVPRTALGLLQRDTLTYESPSAYDGGDDGTELLRRAITESTEFLRPGGSLLLELGADQADLLADALTANGFDLVKEHHDDDGDPRAIEARFTKLRG